MCCSCKPKTKQVFASRQSDSSVKIALAGASGELQVKCNHRSSPFRWSHLLCHSATDITICAYIPSFLVFVQMSSHVHAFMYTFSLAVIKMQKKRKIHPVATFRARFALLKLNFISDQLQFCNYSVCLYLCPNWWHLWRNSSTELSVIWVTRMHATETQPLKCKWVGAQIAHKACQNLCQISILNTFFFFQIPNLYPFFCHT